MYDEVELQRGIEAEGSTDEEKFNKFMENFRVLKQEYDRMEKEIIHNNLQLQIYYVIPKVDCYK